MPGGPAESTRSRPGGSRGRPTVPNAHSGPAPPCTASRHRVGASARGKFAFPFSKTLTHPRSPNHTPASHHRAPPSATARTLLRAENLPSQFPKYQHHVKLEQQMSKSSMNKCKLAQIASQRLAEIASRFRGGNRILVDALPGR